MNGALVLAEVAGALLAAAGLALAVPVLVFAAQVAAACLPARRAPGASARPPVALLVPAHDEAAGLAAPLAAMRAQMRPGDRLLVVADNCSDDTAAVARGAGAEVVERTHADLRGKGYALAFGVDHLRAAPPPVVVIVDADCLLAPGALDALAADCQRRQAPVQACYLMGHAGAARLTGRVAAFAWAVKNRVRPRGGERLGWPCPLTGSGMAFPWALIADAPLATGHLAEDMQLGLDLARAGHAPRFCEAAVVTSHFPESARATATQRTRWEHGHLGLIVQRAWPLWREAARRRDVRLAAMALDLAVPPLALLVLGVVALWLAAAGVSAVAPAAALPAAAFGLASAAGVAMAAAVLAAWLRWGRGLLSAWDLLGIPWYVLGKLGVYTRFLTRRQTAWVRTGRDDGAQREDDTR
ncbi:glycosyltransferase [Ideonella sp.]|uniref:glycosyltransferase family 2 protein n=1 Tax=Ideonella sp. TaxID=1929293 RepID=UPI0035B2A433